jgi:hypothetical protein
MERDYTVLRELDRWRFALSRQIRLLCGFPSQRTCDRRLKFLIDNKYVERKYILYGTPGLYTATHKGRMLIGASRKPDKIRVEQITHDIAVVDTAIYFNQKRCIELSRITTEKELHRLGGFGVRKHRPDFVYRAGGKMYCVEIELTPKNKDRMLKILGDNFTEYERQLWIVPRGQVKIRTVLEENMTTFPNIEVIALERITEFVKQDGRGIK